MNLRVKQMLSRSLAVVLSIVMVMSILSGTSFQISAATDVAVPSWAEGRLYFHTIGDNVTDQEAWAVMEVATTPTNTTPVVGDYGTGSSFRVFLPKTAKNSDGTYLVYNNYSTSITIGDTTIASGKTGYVSGNATRVKIGYGSTVNLSIFTSKAEENVYINANNTTSSRYLSSLASAADLAGALGLYGGISYKGNALVYNPTITLVQENGKIDASEIGKQVKGRGNTTWRNAVKKSWNFNLNSKVSVSGMAKGKKYSLLANHQEPSLARNRLLYDLADSVGVPYATDSRFANVYFDGLFIGAYLLTQKNDSIVDLEDPVYNEDGSVKDLEFLMELAVDPQGDDFEMTPGNHSGIISVVAPEAGDLTSAQKSAVGKYIKEKYDGMYKVLADPNSSYEELSKWLDVESLAKVYLINELGKNYDAGVSSFYLTYKEGRFLASPTWDYDNSLGNCNTSPAAAPDYRSTSGWWCRYWKSADGSYSGNLVYRATKNKVVMNVARAAWLGTSQEDSTSFAYNIQKFANTSYKTATLTKNTGLLCKDYYIEKLKDSATQNFYKWYIQPNDWCGNHGSLKMYSLNYDKLYAGLQTNDFTIKSSSVSLSSSTRTYHQASITSSYDNGGQYEYAADYMISRGAWLTYQYATDVQKYYITDKSTDWKTAANDRELALTDITSSVYAMEDVEAKVVTGEFKLSDGSSYVGPGIGNVEITEKTTYKGSVAYKGTGATVGGKYVFSFRNPENWKRVNVYYEPVAGNLWITCAGYELTKDVTYYVAMNGNKGIPGLAMKDGSLVSMTKVEGRDVFEAKVPASYYATGLEKDAEIISLDTAAKAVVIGEKKYHFKTKITKECITTGIVWLEADKDMNSTSSVEVSYTSANISAETVRVYLTNSYAWSTPKIYYWGGTSTVPWSESPAMKYVATNSNSQKVYYYDIPADTTFIIFRDGGSTAQTTNIALSELTAEKNNAYYIRSGSGAKCEAALISQPVIAPTITSYFTQVTMGAGDTASIAAKTTGTKVSYSSSDENIVTVEEATGELQGVAVGTAVITITVTGTNGDTTEAMTTVEVIGATTISVDYKTNFKEIVVTPTPVVTAAPTKEPVKEPEIFVAFDYDNADKVADTDLDEYTDGTDTYTYLATTGEGTMTGTITGEAKKHLSWTTDEYLAEDGSTVGIQPAFGASKSNKWTANAAVTVKTSTVGYKELSVAFELGASKKGPANYNVYISDGYISELIGSFTMETNKTMYHLSFDIPEAYENEVDAKLVVALADTTAVNGNDLSAAATGGEFAINNIVFKGIKDGSSIPATPKPTVAPTAAPTEVATAKPVVTEQPKKNVVTVYYDNTAWEQTYIHYKVSGGVWTVVPGYKMEATTEQAGYQWKYTIDLGTEEVAICCFNSGSGVWDSNGGRNFTVQAGTYGISLGSVYELKPVVTVAPTAVPTAASTEAPVVTKNPVLTAEPVKTEKPVATEILVTKAPTVEPTKAPVVNTVTVYYNNTAWTPAYIHYKVAGDAWTIAPGVKMEANTEQDGYNWKYVIVLGEAESADVCFNNGYGAWDSLGGQNFKVYKGVYGVSLGKVYKLSESMVTVMPTMNVTVAPTGQVATECPVITPEPTRMPGNMVTVYYGNTTWSEVNIHYKTSSGVWTTVPGVKMERTEEQAGYQWKYTIDLGSLDATSICFNNGNGSWDSRNGGNYQVSAGVFGVKDGNVHKINES